MALGSEHHTPALLLYSPNGVEEESSKVRQQFIALLPNEVTTGKGGTIAMSLFTSNW